MNPKLKNRGAITNPAGRFEKNTYEAYDDGWFQEPAEGAILETSLMPENSKTLVTTNDSPDIGFDQSINPYRGCEHGCIYCYARPAHSYVNLSPGIDFETKIFYKKDAIHSLRQQFNKKNYHCKTIVIGANTDPYQPAEAKLKITRQIIETLKQYKHPLAIITKSALIYRDRELLAELAKDNLVNVAITLTTLNKDLKKILEPRAAAPSARLRVIKEFIQLGIPITLMVAPIIPMINDMEMEKIMKAASDVGAQHAGYTLIRLPYEVKDLFREWLVQHYPARAVHIMSLINQMRGGKDYDSTFHSRMRGEGEFAQLIAKRFRLACKRYGINTKPSVCLDPTQFVRPNLSAQLDLFS